MLPGSHLHALSRPMSGPPAAAPPVGSPCAVCVLCGLSVEGFFSASQAFGADVDVRVRDGHARDHSVGSQTAAVIEPRCHLNEAVVRGHALTALVVALAAAGVLRQASTPAPDRTVRVQTAGVELACCELMEGLVRRR